MTHLEFECSDEKALFILKAARLYDEGLRNLPEWIPCSERLPEEYGEYLATLQGEHDSGFATIVNFIPNNTPGLISGWSTCDADGYVKLSDQEVVAWQPLPKPYEEE